MKINGFTFDNYTAVGIAEGFEEAESEEEELAAWQYLVVKGLAWTLQGRFGRTATQLIDEGHILTAEDYNAQVVS